MNRLKKMWCVCTYIYKYIHIHIYIFMYISIHTFACVYIETQAGIKISGRTINDFRYADNTTLMVKSEEELKSLLMKVKE